MKTNLPILFAAASLLALRPCPAAETKKLAQDHAEIYAEMAKKDHVAAWQRYPVLPVPLMPKAPVVDGTIGSEEWRLASSLGYVLEFNTSLKVQDKARFLVGCTATRLYMAFQFERPETARAPADNDWFEVLLDPSHGHAQFLDMIANVKGVQRDGVGPNLRDDAWSPAWEYKARVTETGWEAEMSVAFTDIPGCGAGAPAPGTIWGADFIRNERTPGDRLALWAWRSNWHASKDFAHLLFTGRPVAVRAEGLGWMPSNGKCGAKVEVVNGSDRPVEIDAFLELRKAAKKPTLNFLQAVDSAMTENLGAAIGSKLGDEVKQGLAAYPVLRELKTKVAVPPQTAKMLEVSEKDEPGLYLASFHLAEGKQDLAGMTVPFGASVPLNMNLFAYLWSAQTLAWEVDVRSIREKVSGKATLTVLAEREGDAKPVATSQPRPIGESPWLTGELKFAPVAASTYRITARVQEGDKVYENRVPLVVPPKPDWIGTSVGRKKFVPPPWVPLKAGARECETKRVRWQWPEGALVPSFAVAGKNYLAAPPALSLKDGNGQVVPLKVTSLKLKASDAEEATWQLEADAGPLGALSASVRVEFDGFAWFDVTLRPKPGAEIGGCTLELPMKKEFGRLFQRGRMSVWFDPKSAPKEGSSAARAGECGRVPAEGFELPFVFQVWLGNQEGGVQWCAERPENWHLEDNARAIQVKPAADRTLLAVHFVDKKVRLDGPLTWSFGLMPTPSRQPIGGLEQHAYFQTGGFPVTQPPPESLKATDPNTYRKRVAQHQLAYGGGWKEGGVKRVIVFSGWNYNDREKTFGYPGTHDPETQRQLREFTKAMHAQGIQVLLYIGWGISSECPEWKDYGWEMVILPIKNSGYGTYWAHPSGLFPDLYVHHVAEMVKTYDLDGVYIDSTSDLGYSLNYAGMRWVDAKGEVKGTYAVRAMRDFFKRIYKVFHGEARADGIVYNHHSPQPNVFIENFTDLRCPSEFAQTYKGEFNEEFVDMFLVKNTGLQFGLQMELTNKNWMGEWAAKKVNQVYSLLLPLNVGFKMVNLAPAQDYSLMGEPMPKLWKTWAWLESAKAEHLPWWKNAAYVTTQPASDPKNQVLSALWLRKGEKAVLCVSNLKPGPRTIEVALNLPNLGFAAVSAEDAITGEAVPVKGDRLSLPVDSERWRLLKLSPAK
jgi:hypothetical protein